MFHDSYLLLVERFYQENGENRRTSNMKQQRTTQNISRDEEYKDTISSGVDVGVRFRLIKM